MDAADADDEAAVALAAAVFADVAAFVSDVFASAADAAAAFSDAAAAVADAPVSPALEAACVSDIFAAVSDAPARSADVCAYSDAWPAAVAFLNASDAWRATSSTIASKRRSASGRTSSSVMAPRKSFRVPGFESS